VQSIGLAVNGGARVRELWRFACEGYFGDLTRDHAEKLAELEAELSVTVDGEEIPFRMVRPALANEPDRDKRRELDALANDVLDEHMNPLHLDAAQVIQQGARDLGFANYLELYRKALPSSALDDLAEQCRYFLDSTQRLYEDAADKLFRTRVGVSLSEAHGGTCRGSSVRRSGTRCSPPIGWCRRSSRRSPTSASTSTRRRT
jgi:hypothetical protein